MRRRARLTEPIEVAACHVISEAIADAAKHSVASVVDIGADIAGNVRHLRVVDGRRRRCHLRPGLRGWSRLKDRVEALGGTIAIDSPPARVRAWMLICRWPPHQKRSPLRSG